MKQFIMINGTMGAGKSTISALLNQRLSNSVWLDGDWCWMADPFVVTDCTKRMVIGNIVYLLQSFLQEAAYEHIIFCWVMDQQDIIDDIINRLSLSDISLSMFTLMPSAAQLTKQIQADPKRSAQDLVHSLQRCRSYEALSTIKVYTDGKSLESIAAEIQEMIA